MKLPAPPRTMSLRTSDGGWLATTITTDMSSSPRRLRHNRSSRRWSSVDAISATRLGLAASVSLLDVSAEPDWVLDAVTVVNPHPVLLDDRPVLSRAVQWHCADHVIRYANQTVVLTRRLLPALQSEQSAPHLGGKLLGGEVGR